jgi:hypothetical protein
MSVSIVTSTAENGMKVLHVGCPIRRISKKKQKQRRTALGVQGLSPVFQHYARPFSYEEIEMESGCTTLQEDLV